MEKRWKVLIADDEPWIREGIRDAVDWTSLGMEVVAEAEDGEEALELALEHSAEVLLVDLNMPIMNGIELMKRVREELPGSRIVVITGHDEFVFAQEAIRLEVDDYILKPADPKQLHTVLGNVRRKLELAEKQNGYLAMASKQISKNFPLLRERFCLEWVEGTMTEGEILEQLQFLELPASAPQRLGIIRWPESSAPQRLMKESDRQLLLFAIENIAAELLEPYRHAMFRDTMGLLVVCLWEAVPESVYAEIERAVQTYLKLTVHLCFEHVEGSVTEIASVYRHCRTKVYEEQQISPIVRRARQYIRDRFTDSGLTLESAAAELQMSPVYLSRVLKQELGMPFVSLVTQMRIQLAVQLLGGTDLPVGEIAERTGYESQHYFSTAFKKVMGVSPNQYRRGVVYTEGRIE
ncbi:response regulator transcription factor [Paenibacillus caseinilyticus]|uniref:AraC family transcriptional regulator n=1 Tax=Paenibacillus mucilaginosus K02 TaxID=997761 RepID=I0BS17_9BACL|nr:response regulator [Paenibacillus mucilaginosus]AFH65164.1 AraC family transcriptional regulator [Paenibacillus mucilaginosus K02]